MIEMAIFSNTKLGQNLMENPNLMFKIKKKCEECAYGPKKAQNGLFLQFWGNFEPILGP